MAINQTFLLNDIADDLAEMGEWGTEEGGYLERQLRKAMYDVFQAKAWKFKIAQETLTLDEDSLGPYDPPDDFDGLIPPEELSKYYALPQYAVPPPVPDDSYGRKQEVYVNRVTGKLYLWVAPESGDVTFTYRRKFTGLDDLASWPDDEWLKKTIIARASYYALSNTPEFRDQAMMYKQQSEEMIEQEWKEQRRAMSRPDQRTPQDMGGFPLHWDL